MNPSRRRLLVGSIGALGFAAACGRREEETVAPGARIVRVAQLRISPHLMAPKFYQRFLPPDIHVQTIAFNNSTEIKTAIVTQSVDFGVTGITAALQGASRDEPVRALAAAADGASAIVAHQNAGVESVRDLRGKIIGYVPASAQDILLRLSLRANGLDAQRDVKLLKVGFGDMPNALERGDIHAFTGAETGPSLALSRGHARLVSRPYDTKMGKINIVFCTSLAMIKKDPDLCRTMVAAHAKATDYMSANPEEWARATIKTWGATIEVVRLAIGNIFLRWHMDPSYIDQARALGSELLALKQMKKEPDYGAFMDPSFLPPLAEAAR
jgi:NitT/TauT family transport system substrate-binding protein